MDYRRMSIRELREEFKKKKFARGIPDLKEDLILLLEEDDRKILKRETDWRELVKAVREPKQGWRAILENGTEIPLTIDVIVDHRLRMITYKASYSARTGLDFTSSVKDAEDAAFSAWRNIVAENLPSKPVEFLRPGEKSRAEIIKELGAALSALQRVQKVCGEPEGKDSYYHRFLDIKEIVGTS